MTDPQQISTLMMVVALLLSLSNLLIALARSRVKQAEVDLQALQMAVNLAERTPELEAQFRQATADLRAAQTEAGECRSRLDELNQLIALQADEIHRLKQENDEKTLQIKDMQAMLQTLQTG